MFKKFGLLNSTPYFRFYVLINLQKDVQILKVQTNEGEQGSILPKTFQVGGGSNKTANYNNKYLNNIQPTTTRRYKYNNHNTLISVKNSNSLKTYRFSISTLLSPTINDEKYSSWTLLRFSLQYATKASFKFSFHGVIIKKVDTSYSGHILVQLWVDEI